jgi:hypothetical protein
MGREPEQDRGCDRGDQERAGEPRPGAVAGQVSGFHFGFPN